MIDNILLILFVLILAAKLLGGIFEKLGLDSSLGELLTGIIFGVGALNLITAESIETFAIIGSVLILFLAGLKQRDVETVYKDKPALTLGLSLLLITAIVMSLFFYFIPPFFEISVTLIQALVLGLAFAVIDIGVPAKVLISKGLINTPVGRVTIRSAIINIISGLLIFTLVTIFVRKDFNDALFKFGGVVLFLIVTIGLFYFLSKISKFIMKIRVEEAEFSLAFVLILALAYVTEVIGFSSILGAFVAGVLIAKMPFAESKSFCDKIQSLSFGLFVPLFFVWFGLEINLLEIWHNIGIALLTFVAYCIVRFSITYSFMKHKKLSFPLLVSSSMLSVDVESLVILLVAIQLGIFTTALPFTLFAPSVFLSTLLIVVLVAIFSTKKDKSAKGLKVKN